MRCAFLYMNCANSWSLKDKSLHKGFRRATFDDKMTTWSFDLTLVWSIANELDVGCDEKITSNSQITQLHQLHLPYWQWGSSKFWSYLQYQCTNRDRPVGFLSHEMLVSRGVVFSPIKENGNLCTFSLFLGSTLLHRHFERHDSIWISWILSTC